MRPFDGARRHKLLTRALRTLGMALLMLAAASFGWRSYRAHAGEPSQRLAESWHRGHPILDRDGRLLRELPSDLGQRGQPLPLEAMGDRLVIATIVAEDQRFYEHGGFDAQATLRAVSQNVRHLRVVSGASTISQQLVKLLDHGGVPPSGRTLTDKLDEAARAQNLERRLSKQQILTAYLNRLPYGRGRVGPDAAARGMFGVPPQQLSWAQATLMAVLPRAPSYLDPYRHRERAVSRQHNLLQLLHDAGWLSDEDLRRAKAEPLQLLPARHPFEAPHLTEALRLDKLSRFGQLGTERTRTTIELPLQRDVEGLLATHVARVRDRGVSNAAAVVVDNASGEILAYVGGADWHDQDISGQLDMARARRQPGSTLKPFVYAMAFEGGLSPAGALADVPTSFGEPSGAYAPSNFDRSFLGPVSAREALAGSLNVPAVRLAAELPRGALLGILRDAGLRSLDRPAEHYGLSLALGSGEVSLIELAEAYVMLARGGVRLPLRLTRSDAQPDAQPSAAPGQRVLPADAVAAVSDSLSDPLARIRGLGSRGPFDIGMPVAVKTGTSSGYRDSWTVGYTRESTVAVWMGNADGRPARELTGGDGAGPLFADIMRRAMQPIDHPQPLYAEEQLATVAVCPLSGKPVGPACPETVTRRVPRSQLHHHRDGTSCSYHRHVRQRPGAALQCAASGVAAVTLPASYDDWLGAQPPGAPGRDPHGLAWWPASELSACGEQTRRGRLRIAEPASGSVVVKVASISGAQQRLQLSARYDGPTSEAPERIEFVLDGEVIGSSPQPYQLAVEVRRGDHVLSVRPADARRALAPARSHFSVR